jgi:hypothetical protein
MILKREELIGKEFKWVSTKTGGETFGIIEKIINPNWSPKIVSTKENAYYLSECTVKVNDEFIIVNLEKNVGDYQTS